MKQILTNEEFLNIFDTVEKLHGRKIEKSNKDKNKSTLYHSISKQDFEQEKQKVLNNLPKLTKSELTYEIYRLFALFKDAHTALFSTKYNIFVYLQMEMIDNKIVITGISKDCQDLLLKEIEAINGVPIRQIIKKAKTLVPAETDEYANNKIFSYNYLQRPHFLEALGLGDCSKGINIKVDGQEYFVPTGVGNKLPFKTVSPIKKVAKNYEIQKIDSVNVLYYKKAAEDANYPIKQLIKDLKNALKEDNNIVVDLRNNSGGSSKFFEDISKETFEKFGTKGVVLTNHLTFSAATWAAMHCKALGFVNMGEEWGEPTKRFGDSTPEGIDIPQLDLCYQVSEKYFDLNDAYNMPVATNKPDIEVHNTLDDYKNNYDRVLFDAVEYIKSNQKNNKLGLNR